LASASGAVINHLDYDSFGRLIAQTNAAVGDRYTFTGREWDAEIGLYYYRARFFDPQLGRFVSQDPLGFDASDVNLYRYVGNSPLTMVDPMGQEAAEYSLLSRSGIVAASGVAGYVLGWVCGYLDAAYSDDPTVSANRFQIAEQAGQAGFVMGAASGLVAPVFPAISTAVGIVGASGYLFASGNNTQRGIRVGCIAAGVLTGGAIGRLGPKVPRAPIDKYFGGVVGRFMRGESGSIGPQPSGPNASPEGIPPDWVASPTKGAGGTKYVDPTNPGNSVRVMPGNPKSPYPNSQKPYVRWQKNGQALDKNGNVVAKNTPDAHIPEDEFHFDPNLFK
jgi:RHS repeat-associated protein